MTPRTGLHVSILLALLNAVIVGLQIGLMILDPSSLHVAMVALSIVVMLVCLQLARTWLRRLLQQAIEADRADERAWSTEGVL